MANNKKSEEQAALDRAEVYRIITEHPMISVQAIADLMGREKSSIYQYVARLRTEGKITSSSMPLPNGHYGRVHGYSVAESVEDALNHSSRFDSPSQYTVAATDGAKLPEPDPILSALFGRNKETA